MNYSGIQLEGTERREEKEEVKSASWLQLLLHPGALNLHVCSSGCLPGQGLYQDITQC